MRWPLILLTSERKEGHLACAIFHYMIDFPNPRNNDMVHFLQRVYLCLCQPKLYIPQCSRYRLTKVWNNCRNTSLLLHSDSPTIKANIPLAFLITFYTCSLAIGAMRPSACEQQNFPILPSTKSFWNWNLYTYCPHQSLTLTLKNKEFCQNIKLWLWPSN